MKSFQEDLDQYYQAKFWKEIVAIIRERDSYRTAIQAWLDYTGDNGDAEFDTYFRKILEDK